MLGRKGSCRLGWEISPSLRTLSPHLWPHPLWVIALSGMVWCLPVGWKVRFITAGLLGVPLLRAEQRAYLRRLKELPEQGFIEPTFGIVHGWRTFFYSLYLHGVTR